MSVQDISQINLSSKVGAASQASESNSTDTTHHSADYYMWQAMLTLTNELGILSDAQVSESKLATALYKNMVPNATNALKDMQKNLNDYTWLQEHFAAYAAYFKGGETGTPPPLGPDMSAGDVARMKAFYETHPTLTGCRMAVTTLAQQVSSQNTYVQDAKALPTGLENGSKSLADSQGQDASQIPGYLALMKNFFSTPW